MAHSKLIAKILASRLKPAGSTTLDLELEAEQRQLVVHELVDELPVRSMTGFGSSITRRLVADSKLAIFEMWNSIAHWSPSLRH